MNPVDHFLKRALAQRQGRAGAWQELDQDLRGFIQRADLPAIERIATALDNPEHTTLASMAWRGRVYAGVEGARRFLEDVAAPPLFERGWPDRDVSRVLDYGVLLAHAWDSATLATLLQKAPNGVARAVITAAVEERVLRDGAVTEPILVSAWTGPDWALSAHRWERGILSSIHAYFKEDTLGNWHHPGPLPPWPEGITTPGEAPTLEALRQWSYDADFDRVGPQEPPPVGPMADSALYPNGLTWCIETLTERAEPELSRWPFPTSSVDTGLTAEPISAETLFRWWLWRGLSGGAYGAGTAAGRARLRAWSSLAELAGVPGGPQDWTPDTVADAAEGLQVFGFRARGPHIEALGADFGFVVWRPDGMSWAAVHSDSD